MSANLQFFIFAAILSLAALGILLSPWWRKTKTEAGSDRRQANLDIFRDQLRELERNRDEGLLAGADFEQAKAELQHRLLEETAMPAGETVATARRDGWHGALLLAVLVPLAAALIYSQIGNPQGLQPPQAQAHQQAQELDALLAKLVERLKANPGDLKGWVILARSYKALGRFEESVAAFEKAQALVDTDAELLASYADMLIQANGGTFTNRAEAVLGKALKLDPDQAQALFMAGIAANERRDFAAAVAHWERLLPQLEPGSEDALVIEEALAKARAEAGRQGDKVPAKKLPATASSAKTAIDGEVVLSGKLAAKAQPEDTLYVFARAAEGSRMPLAVVRARVADLPFKFSLDDKSSLPGGMKLSAAASVVVEARITTGGMAQTSPGDLYGTLKGIKPGSRGVRLVIDQVQP